MAQAWFGTIYEKAVKSLADLTHKYDHPPPPPPPSSSLTEELNQHNVVEIEGGGGVDKQREAREYLSHNESLTYLCPWPEHAPYTLISRLSPSMWVIASHYDAIREWSNVELTLIHGEDDDDDDDDDGDLGSMSSPSSPLRTYWIAERNSPVVHFAKAHHKLANRHSTQFSINVLTRSIHRKGDDPLATAIHKMHSEELKRKFKPANPLHHIIDNHRMLVISPIVVEMFLIWEANQLANGISTISLLDLMASGDENVTKELIDRALYSWNRDQHNSESMGNAYMAMEAMHHAHSALSDFLELDLESPTVAKDLIKLRDSPNMLQALKMYEQYVEHTRKSWSTARLDAARDNAYPHPQVMTKN